MGPHIVHTLVQCEAPKIAKVGAHNSNFTMVYGIYNELVTGANLNQKTYLGGLTLYHTQGQILLGYSLKSRPEKYCRRHMW